MKMEVVKLSYFPIVLYCLLASYSEALPFRSLDSKGKKHCINLKLNPSKWELRYVLKWSQIHGLLRSFEFAHPSFDDLSKIVHTYIFFFSVCGTRSYHWTSQSSHRVKRIVQGNKADHAEWPWQISILERDKGTYKAFFLC